jgi:CBS domain-containing protein
MEVAAMLVSDVMTTDVVTVSEETPLHDVAKLLVDRRVSGLPVTDAKGRVVGVVSEGDFVNAAGHRGALRQLLTRVYSVGRVGGSQMEDGTVGRIMSRPARTIAEDRPVSEAAAQMARWKVNRLPVVRGETLVGIITRADIVRLYARSDEDLHAAVRDALAEVPDVRVNDVTDGRVILSGEVPHQAVAEAARMIAGSVEGVISVDTSGIHYRRAFLDR